MTAPDLFTNVHKGIRKALFEAAIALGRATDGDARDAAARAQLRQTLRFVEQHGDNEDALLVPLLERSAPELAQRMTKAHAPVGAALSALRGSAETASIAELYRATNDFVALYLEHMREEECELEAAIRAVLSVPELQEFGRQAVARTAPSDQRTMLRAMLPAMTHGDAQAVLARLPPALATELGEQLGLGA